VSYLNRSGSSHSGAPELWYLLFVLVAGVVTAWWASPRIGMDLSSLNSAPALLGFGQATGVQSRPQSGYEAPAIPQAAPQAAPQVSAPYCAPGQTPAFQLGLAELKRQVGATMGDPVECEHPSSGSGDTVQQTTTGLAAYNRRSNTSTFTNGWQHWGLTSSGLVTWEGTESEPPPRAVRQPGR
jgi:hypothetical protein